MIRVENLTKDYGDVRAIDKIGFEVQAGEIVGFLGPNGAGKTTTLKIITTYITPTEGRVFVDDMDVAQHPDAVRSRVGYLPELNPLYNEMTVADLLTFTASVRKVTGGRFKEALRRVIQACGIREVMHRNIGELSKGYRQRVGLAQAIIHDPQILIMDEPTSGLDPNQIVEIRELIKELGREKTVVLSTHILQEVHALADRMVILNKGRVVANGTTAELMAGFEGKAQLFLEAANTSDESISGLQVQFPSVTVTDQNVKDGVARIHLDYPTGSDMREQIFRYAVDADWVLLEMSRKRVQLEDVFRSLTLEGEEARA